MSRAEARGDPPKRLRSGGEAEALVSFGGDGILIPHPVLKGKGAADGDRRGWVEVIPAAEPGQLWVHDWSEFYDTGAIVATFDACHRASAVAFALRYAAENGRKPGRGLA